MRNHSSDWVDRWLVGQTPDGSFRVVPVKARPLPNEGAWLCDLRPNCDSLMVETVDAVKVYASEAGAAERARQLSATAPN